MSTQAQDADLAVVHAVQAGDTERFRELVDRHRERIFAVLVRIVADADLARELAQETFVRAFRGLPTFREEARMGTWLVQIAVHLARDHMRASRRAPVISLDDIVERAGEMPFSEQRRSFDPAARVSDRELRDRLDQAITSLPPEYREAFVLKHVEELPYERIAEITGVTVGALKVRVHRARRMLMEQLSDSRPDDVAYPSADGRQRRRR